MLAKKQHSSSSDGGREWGEQEGKSCSPRTGTTIRKIFTFLPSIRLTWSNLVGSWISFKELGFSLSFFLVFILEYILKNIILYYIWYFS